jgi:hypothetical protein
MNDAWTATTLRMTNATSIKSRRHHGVNFAIWEVRGAWFWFFIDPSGQGGSIGASANEAQAIRDARFSIEEKLVEF